MLKVCDIHQQYEGKSLLDGISFSLKDFETICLLGASGSGKSTLLRIISGLEAPDSGNIFWNGEDLSTIPTHERRFGLMFQDYALFPFLNVTENVAFGLKFQKMDQKEIRSRVSEVLDSVELEGFENRNVINLSGGEQQRVALARTLAPRPRLLMLDEPLGALDHNLKEHLLFVLRRILRSNRVPVIYVTHDQEEAFAMADRILILNEGRIIISGTPQELWEDPGSSWTAGFLGLGNIIPGKWMSQGRVETAFGVYQCETCEHQHRSGEMVDILIRPEIDKNSSGINCLEGQVEDIQFTKKGYKVTLHSDLYFYQDDPPETGELIRINFSSDGVLCLG